ncbi:MAG: hypothetical protein GKS06_00800 [Acidobacteria bacterium]|nr:hypothetical protein [Acidobacteriota bacterium]
MSARRFTPAAFLVAAAVCLAAPVTGQDPAETVGDAKQRGVSWVAGRSIDGAALDPLLDHHVEWIAQTPFGWQEATDKPAIRIATGGRVFWGETDEGLSRTLDLARERGLRTMLKPHIWVSGGAWRGDIYMPTDADWNTWFADYREFILHYAQFAESRGIPLFCIGTELHKTVIARPGKWRDLIREIRDVYSGELTYAANWYDEFTDVSFWEELDYIGVQGYFPLSHEPTPGVDALVAGWGPHRDALRDLHERVGKPVIFTEIGYRSWSDAASRPWEWPIRGDDSDFDAVIQKNLYEAFFRTFWHEDWVVGAYWWKWFPGHSAAGGPGHNGFTPQNKLAADVMAAWFAGDRPDTE